MSDARYWLQVKNPKTDWLDDKAFNQLSKALDALWVASLEFEREWRVVERVYNDMLIAERSK